MAEQTAVAVAEVAEIEQKAATPTGDATGQEQKAEVTASTTFTQADVDRIVAERLQRAERKAQEQAQKAAQEAERKAAEEQGKWKELYEKTQAEINAERNARKTLEMNILREKVARQVGLPEKLAARLQGEDEDSLLADAKSILAELPKPAAPNINNGAGVGNVPPAGGMTEAEKRELAARLGVNPIYL